MGVSQQVRQEEGDSHCGSSGEQLKAGRGGEKGWIQAGGSWLINLFRLPPGAQGRLLREVCLFSRPQVSGVGQAPCKALGAWE